MEINEEWLCLPGSIIDDVILEDGTSLKDLLPEGKEYKDYSFEIKLNN